MEQDWYGSFTKRAKKKYYEIREEYNGTDYFTASTPLHKPILPPSLLNFPLHLLADLHPGRAAAQTGTIAFITGHLVGGVETGRKQRI